MRHAFHYGFFTVIAMPNQPSVAICSDFTVYKKHRGTGKAHTLKEMQTAVLERQGFTLAICTVKSSNLAQIKVLEKAEWVHRTSFYDVRSDDLIQFWTLNVKQES